MEKNYTCIQICRYITPRSCIHTFHAASDTVAAFMGSAEDEENGNLFS